MTRKMNPGSVREAVYDAVAVAVFDAVNVDVAVDGAVLDAVDWPVREAVLGAVDDAMDESVRVSPTHPNLDRFVAEIRQVRARWGAAWAAS